MADSLHGFGPTERVNVQNSSNSCGAFAPATSAPLASSTV